VFAFSTVGIIVFSEMSGRVAAVAKQPVFNLMRHRLGLKLGLVTLAASLIANLITCAAEVGGVALVLNYLTGAPYRLMAVAGTVVLMASMWVLPFKWIERTYGLLGLFMIVFAVAIVSAVMFPYEAYFYSSGGIEEKWGPKDLPMNKITCTIGFGLGSLLSLAILASSAQLFTPASVDPQLLGSSALEAAIPFGSAGLLIALLGMLFAISGAAVETCMANAYSIAQFFGWEWGRHRKPWDAPRFTIAWVMLFLSALAIILTGIDPMQLVEYAILFSILVLPLTYLPLLLLAGDKSDMRQYANGTVGKALGWLYFALITLAALGALPLYFLTSGGQG
jgi:Mn2+/Fe2+ NRAMP family transporter